MKNSIRPHLALLLCNSIWALNYPLYKLVIPSHVSALSMVTATLIVAAVLSLLTLLWNRPERIERSDMLKLVGAALLIGVMRKFFLMDGLSLTSPIDGSIINTMGPILVLIISVVMHIDRFTPMKIAGIVMGATGAVMVVAFGGSAAHPASELRGNLFVLLSAFSTALYMVWFKQLISKYKPLTALRWVYCIAALAILPFGGSELVHTDFSALTGASLWAFLFILLVPTFGPNFLLIYSLKYVSPTITSIYTYLQPILATVIAVAMGMDKLHWDTVLAAVVIFGGVLLVIRSYENNATAPTVYHH